MQPVCCLRGHARSCSGPRGRRVPPFLVDTLRLAHKLRASVNKQKPARSASRRGPATCRSLSKDSHLSTGVLTQCGSCQSQPFAIRLSLGGICGRAVRRASDCGVCRAAWPGGPPTEMTFFVFALTRHRTDAGRSRRTATIEVKRSGMPLTMRVSRLLLTAGEAGRSGHQDGLRRSKTVEDERVTG